MGHERPGGKNRRMGKLRNVTCSSLWVPEIGGLLAAPGNVAPDGLAAMCCDCNVPLTPPQSLFLDLPRLLTAACVTPDSEHGRSIR